MSSKIFFLPIIGVTTFFLLLFTFTKIFGPIPFAVNSVTTTKSTTFDVTGEGKSSAQPDIALVTVGINTNGNSIKEVQDQVNSTINKVSGAIKNLGIDSKDIQTTNYSVNPSYDYQSSPPKITGYSASTNLRIKIRNLDKANQVIDTATGNGANQVSGISFDIDDKTKPENEARQQAVADARNKAEQAAKIAGFRLGRIVNYSETFGNQPRPLPMAVGGMNVKTSDSIAQIEPGTNEVSVTVTLSYEIQ